jgi:hypothetical protein
MHPKNMHSLLNYKTISIEIVNKISDIDNYDLTKFDYVYSPSDPIDISKYPNTFFIFGPHFSTFPNHKILNIQSNKSLYIMPSQWCIDDWKKNPLCQNLNMISCPFGVDTDKFYQTNTIQNRNSVFVYYKSRNPQELLFIDAVLKQNNINYKLFNYHQRYDENEYIQYLKESKYGIWIDAHESQGFALEEALSCNVPLLVWNIRSMNQEYGKNHPDIPATTIPYWDYRCGEYFFDIHEFQETINRFIANLDNYRPREFVLENLSIDVCEKKFLECITANGYGNK